MPPLEPNGNSGTRHALHVWICRLPTIIVAVGSLCVPTSRTGRPSCICRTTAHNDPCTQFYKTPTLFVLLLSPGTGAVGPLLDSQSKEFDRLEPKIETSCIAGVYGYSARPVHQPWGEFIGFSNPAGARVRNIGINRLDSRKCRWLAPAED